MNDKYRLTVSRKVVCEDLEGGTTLGNRFFFFGRSGRRGKAFVVTEIKLQMDQLFH